MRLRRLTETQLKEIEQRAEKVLGKKWDVDVPMETCAMCGGNPYEVVAEDIFLAPIVAEVKSMDDADFIASARSDVPALIAEIRRLHKALREIYETTDELHAYSVAQEALADDHT